MTNASIADRHDPVARMVKSPFTGVDGKIRKYCERFDELRLKLDKKLRFETRIMVTRIFQQIEDIGEW